MTTEPKHLARFEGGNALPGFPRRVAACPAAQRGRPDRGRRGAPRALGLERQRPDARRERPARGAAALRRAGAALAGAETLVVAPRLGTISPWASKATDIARNCGLVVHRIERVTEFALRVEEGAPRPRRGARRQRARRGRSAAARPHDRIGPLRPGRRAPPVRRAAGAAERAVDVRGGGRAALERPTATSASRSPTTRSTTCSMPSAASAATRVTSS